MGRINVSLDAHYQVAQELVIKADLAAPEPSLPVILAAVSCTVLNICQRAGKGVYEVTM